jgi:hypothetical protein
MDLLSIATRDALVFGLVDSCGAWDLGELKL